jgi:alkylation response protein AidB-like acyl-CoA dehydrogenase
MTVLAIHPNKQQYIYGYIPAGRNGLKFHDDWDQLGLRGADSGTITFDHVRIFPEEVLPWTHAGAQVGPAPFWTTFGGIFYSAIFLGSSLAVLDAAREYSRTQRRQSLYPPSVDRATSDPFIQAQYGELLVKVQAGLAFLDQVSQEVQEVWDNRREATEADRGRISLRTLALRAFTANVALEVTPKIYDFTGGRATGTAYGYDRHWRNVRQLSSHDPLIYSVRTLGDFALNDKTPPSPNLFQAHGKPPERNPDLPAHNPSLPLDTDPRALGLRV